MAAAGVSCLPLLTTLVGLWEGDLLGLLDDGSVTEGEDVGCEKVDEW